MKIISWNVNGVRSACKDDGLDKLKDLNPDIVCLQEIKACQEQIEALNLFKGYKLHVNQADKKGYSGVAVYTKVAPKNVITKLGDKRFDKEGRLLYLEFDDFTLINVYLPHGGRQKENLGYKLEIYQKLFQFITSRKNLIIIGDFNIAHQDVDLARPNQNRDNIMFTVEERQQLDKLINLGFADTFRFFTKNSGHYTWWAYMANCRARNIGWRIDYAFVSDDLEKKVKKSVLLPDYLGSDHCPIMLDIEL
jgi:exodeoxyribonuclease-3